MESDRDAELVRTLNTERSAMIVRWAGAAFALLQIYTFYLPYPPGIQALALALTGALIGGNLAIWVLLGRISSPRHARRLAFGGLALDAVVVLGFTFLYTFDGNNAIWALIYLLPLEAAQRFQLRGALVIMAVVMPLYAARELFGAAVYDHDFLPTSISFRMGLGFLIAAFAGVTSSTLVKQRRQAELESRHSAELVRQLAKAEEAAHFGSWHWDIPSDTVSWSDELYRIWGLEKGDLDPSFEGYLAVVHPDDRVLVRDAVEHAYRTGLGFEVQHRIVRNDGAVRVILARGEVVINGAGAVAMTGVGHDITERERAAAELEGYASQLAAANHELQAADRLKDHFFAITNHELRTPLTTILGFATTLNNRWETMADADKRSAVAAIDRQAVRLRGLVEDLLTLSALQNDGLELTLHPVRVIDVIRASVAESGIPEDDVVIECSETTEIVTDPDRLQQILTNYLTNGLKYGVAPFRVQARETQHALELRVIDRGPGVPEDFTPRLFDKFTRASDGTKRTGGGSGLGLAIVRELAEALGGEAWYEPGSPTGSCFGVRLQKAALDGSSVGSVADDDGAPIRR